MSKMATTISMVCGIIVTASTALAAFEHTCTKYDNTIPTDSNTGGSNGKIPQGTLGDSAHAGYPSVLKMGPNDYRMWYSGNDGNWRIYYATSTNGLDWVKYNNAAPATNDTTGTDGRIPLGSSSKGDNTHCRAPCVIYDGGVFKMWYGGSDGSSYRIYYATSPDGLTWTKYNNAIPAASDTNGDAGRLPIGATGGRGDVTHVDAPCVVKDGSIYHMWHGGHDGTDWRIFYAFSTNGLDWVKTNNVIEAENNLYGTDGRIPDGGGGRADAARTFRPWVVKDGSTYRMWYSGYDGTDWRVLHATSSNALDWVKVDNTIPSEELYDSPNSTTNGRIGLGTGTSGDFNYTIGATAIKDDVFKIWYVGSGTGGMRIYYATQVAPSPVVHGRYATNVTGSAADLVGELTSTGAAPTEVFVYWGTNDGGAAEGAWDTNGSLGVVNTGWWTNSLSSLAAGTRYFYRFCASNSYGVDWANESLFFSTVGGPTVGNLWATNLSSSAGLLLGDVLGGSPDPTVYICWGTNNVLTENTSVWDHVELVGVRPGTFQADISGLEAGVLYYFRCYGTNTYGEDWASTNASFVAPGGMTRTWTGIGDWDTPANWNPIGLPGKYDNAVISIGSVLLDHAVTNGSLVIGVGTTVTFTNWSTCYTALSNIIIEGTVTLPVAFTNNGMSNRVWFACSNLTVSTGGLIDTAGRGYAKGTPTRSGQGDGGGGTGGNAGGGGGHGNRGGSGYNGGAGQRYGSASAPVAPGSGGGGCSSYPTNGEDGGGAIRIDATGKVVISGAISADGDDCAASRGAGGSGGSIYITCDTFAGTNGVIRADGGNSGSISGAGAGGRIAVVYNTTAQAAMPKPSVRFSATRGVCAYANGDIGTVYFPDEALFDNTWLPHSGQFEIPGFTNWVADTLTFSNGWMRFAETGMVFTTTNDFKVVAGCKLQLGRGGNILSGRDLIVTNASKLYVYAVATNGSTPFYGALVDVTNTIHIANGATLYPVSESTNGGSVFIRMKHLTIDVGGQINVDFIGYSGSKTSYAAGYGPGKGARRGDNGSGGGGGYGGTGGAGNGVAGGVTYGSSNAPADPGSGGGSGYGPGGYGGGLVRVDVQQSVTVNGTISANGAADNSGAGSGGGIYVHCRSFSGDSGGILRANGGNGGGGGGGGRIAVHSGYLTWDGAASVTNGTTVYAPGPEVGTIMWVDLAPAISNVVATNITTTNAWIIGNLWSTGGVPAQVDGAVSEVYLFWGLTNGGTDKAAWATNHYRGTNAVGLVSNELASLSSPAQYYYRFYTTNTWGGEWAGETKSFSTLGLPEVDNDGGATNIGQTFATLRGDMLSGNPTPLCYICWGDNNAGSTDTGSWDHVEALGLQLGPYSVGVSNLTANKTYWYTCYVTNSYGPDWAPAPTNFMTLSPVLTVADGYVVEGPNATTTNMVFACTLSSSSAIPVSVEFGTTDDTATGGGVDYDTTNGTLTIPAGSMSGSIIVVINGDGTDEFPWEDFDLNLSNAVDLVILDPTMLGRITDDDDVANTKTWTGIGNWSSATNWSPIYEPSASDDVIILSGTVTLSNSVSVTSVIVTNGATMVFTNWTAKLTAPGVSILNGGTMTLPPAFTNNAMSNRVWIACSNLTIETGGAIDVDEKGYAGRKSARGSGPGWGIVGANGSGGGAYGGKGGSGYNAGGGSVYGSMSAPLDPGSSGAGCALDGGSTGGDGGGAVRINASGTVTVDGTITAVGGQGPSRAAGGSGGGIYITCNTFGGMGTVKADGNKSTGIGGRGGGGRIAIICNEAAQIAAPAARVTISAMRGSSGWSANADIGTIYMANTAILDPAWIPHTGELNIPGFTSWSMNSLFVTNGWLDIACDTSFTLTVTNDVTIWGSNGKLKLRRATANVGRDMDILNGGQLYLYSSPTNGVSPAYGALLDVTRDVTIAASSWIYPLSDSTNGGSPLMRMRDLTIDEGGGIDASSKGFRGGISGSRKGLGPGGGNYSVASSYYNAGGGHGGKGGNGTSCSGGQAYGSTNAPTTCGSGGGGTGSGSQYGGGLVRLEVSRALVLNGSILADGQNNTAYAGGAGGGIWIDAQIFSGGSNAVLRADGGNGRASWGGGGGGGRIAVWYGVQAGDRDRIIDGSDMRRVVITNSFENYLGTMSVTGGVAGVQNGAIGTAVFISVTAPGGTVFMFR